MGSRLVGFIKASGVVTTRALQVFVVAIDEFLEPGPDLLLETLRRLDDSSGKKERTPMRGEAGNLAYEFQRKAYEVGAISGARLPAACSIDLKNHQY